MSASKPELDGRSTVPRGLMAEILSLIGSSGRYLQAILALAGEESREALALYTRLLVMLAAAFFFAALGYILLVCVVVFLAAQVLGISLLAVFSALTIVHGLAAILCAKHVRDYSRSPLFTMSRREISRDLEALQKNAPRHE
jgi:uncharacterized membrane protein YqjE